MKVAKTDYWKLFKTKINESSPMTPDFLAASTAVPEKVHVPAETPIVDESELSEEVSLLGSMIANTKSLAQNIMMDKEDITEAASDMAASMASAVRKFLPPEDDSPSIMDYSAFKNESPMMKIKEELDQHMKLHKIETLPFSSITHPDPLSPVLDKTSSLTLPIPSSQSIAELVKIINTLESDIRSFQISNHDTVEEDNNAWPPQLRRRLTRRHTPPVSPLTKSQALVVKLEGQLAKMKLPDTLESHRVKHSILAKLAAEIDLERNPDSRTTSMAPSEFGSPRNFPKQPIRTDEDSSEENTSDVPPSPPSLPVQVKLAAPSSTSDAKVDSNAKRSNIVSSSSCSLDSHSSRVKDNVVSSKSSPRSVAHTESSHSSSAAEIVHASMSSSRSVATSEVLHNVVPSESSSRSSEPRSSHPSSHVVSSSQSTPRSTMPSSSQAKVVASIPPSVPQFGTDQHTLQPAVRYQRKFGSKAPKSVSPKAMVRKYCESCSRLISHRDLPDMFAEEESSRWKLCGRCVFEHFPTSKFASSVIESTIGGNLFELSGISLIPIKWEEHVFISARHLAMYLCGDSGAQKMLLAVETDDDLSFLESEQLFRSCKTQDEQSSIVRTVIQTQLDQHPMLGKLLASVQGVLQYTDSPKIFPSNLDLMWMELVDQVRTHNFSPHN